MFEIEHMNETFDYSLVDNETAEFLKEREYTINGIAEDARIKIGKELKKAKNKLANHHGGVFQKWIQSGGMSLDDAYYYINLNELSRNLDDTKKDNFLNAPKSLQKEVMKKSVPEDLKQKVLDGDITTHKEYKQLQKDKEKLEQQNAQLQFQVEQAQRSEEIARKQLEDEQNREPEVIERYMEPEDYQETKNALAQSRQQQKLIQQRNEKLEKDIKEMEQRRDEVSEKSQKYDELNKAINDMNAKLNDGQQRLKAQKEIYDLVKGSEKVIREVAPLCYLAFSKDIIDNDYARKPIEKIIEDLTDMANRLRKQLKKGDVIDV
ncbi:hypothetical protein [Staphylococcus haemolyticus]|uniref:hypothetical protein n=1 Tax=Staphylococcus haemolyticus TaxID=1283 RepID=UPI001F19F602|nr:hypothetical protein [Staphylococcus haemolyticus]MDU0441578.1 hypothetical protein [Staphylococcus haemolyticus]MDU0473696.1 hypothetical protein [Staphylococcus haemolyticus]